MPFIFQIAAILGTLGLLWFTLRALQRLRLDKSPASRLQIRQRVAVANGCQLVVVQWDGQELLLATGTQSCTMVASRTAPPPLPPVQVSPVCIR